MHRRLLSLTARELARSALFSAVVAAVFGVCGYALWAADISLVQAEVTATSSAALLASVLPAFFAAWTFFLLRRVAWSGPGEAFCCGGAVAGLAVVAHRNVLLSEFFARVDTSDVPAALWIQSALGLLPRAGAVDGTLVAEVAVVFGVGLAAFGVERWLHRKRG